MFVITILENITLFSLEGKIAFITGAGSGIGQHIAVSFAEAGASVGCFDLPRSSEGLNETLERIENAHREIGGMHFINTP